MIYCNNNLKKIIRAITRSVRVFFSSILSKRLLFIIIFVLVAILLHLNTQVQAVTYVVDIDTQIVNLQKKAQDEFVLFSMIPFLKGTTAWSEQIKPIYDDIIENNQDIFCNNKLYSNGVVSYEVWLYRRDGSFTTAQGTYNSQLDGSSNTVTYRNYTNLWKWTFKHTIATDDINNTNRQYPTSVNIWLPIVNYKSPMMYDFLALINGYNESGSINYQSVLNTISTYLSNIDSNTDNLESQLSSILSILNTIANKTENDYTDQIDDITGQVNSVSNSIQAQTQQQHQDAQATQNAINNQTQQQHQDAQVTQNTIEESTNSILSTEADDITMDDFGVQSPTIDGSPDLTNIFNLIYNSFMSVYEDDIYRIQFKLPSGDTTYNFDIPSNALRDKLPDGLIVLISVFWWVILGGAVISFIVKIIHQVVTYSNGSVDGSGGGFLSELTMTPTEFVLFNILH